MQIPVRWHLLSVGFIILVCALVGHFTYSERLNTIKRPVEIKQNALADQTALLINARISLVETQIRLFKHELALFNPEPSELEKVMFSMFKIYSDLLQVRWIDLDGNERVRVDKSPDGSLQAISAENLQNKRKRYYFKAGLTLSDNAIFVSQIDLNVENDLVQRPLQPTLRAVMKATLPNMGKGLLVINFDLRSLLHAIEAISEPDNELLIGAGSNRWIIHPELGKTWRPDLGLERADIDSDLPEIASALSKQLLVQGEEFGNQLYSGQRLPTAVNLEGGLQDIYIINRTPPKLLGKLKLQAFTFALLITAVTAITALALFYTYARHSSQLRAMSQSLQREKKNLQIALKRQATLIDELAEAKKLSSLSIMVAGLAHELNTPVGATQLALSNQERLLEDLITSNQTGLTKSAFENFLTYTHRSLEQATYNNQRAIELIQRFKRLTFDRANDQLNTFNVAEHLDNLCVSMKGLLKRRNVRLEADIPSNITLTGYAGAFTQIVQIIISNAIEHAFEGIYGASITIKCSAEHHNLLVRVADNGVGIADDILPYIFDPFYTSQRDKNHTGLGLHMAKVWIEEAFSGSISVTSVPGHGTTFILSFNQLELLAGNLKKASAES